MRLAGGSASVALLLACVTQPIGAQDTAFTIRHLLPLDVARVQPFQRSYDIVTRVGDSSYVIGQRDLSLSEATYAGTSAWLLVETRTGLVPAAESLYLAPDLRPIHWASTLGLARLGLEFVGDSILGATTSPVGRRSIVVQSMPDVIVSVGMAELLLSVLPLAIQWADSVHVLSVDLGTAAVRPAYLMVTDEIQPVDSAHARVGSVALISGPAETMFTLDRGSGEITTVSMSVPAHVGQRVEFRLRSAMSVAPPPPP